MRKQVYVSADYDPTSGDQAVVNELNKWGNDNFHAVNFVDMSRVSTGSVADGDDCRICDLKAEFNRQINASSVAVKFGFKSAFAPHINTIQVVQSYAKLPAHSHLVPVTIVVA